MQGVFTCSLNFLLLNTGVFAEIHLFFFVPPTPQVYEQGSDIKPGSTLHAIHIECPVAWWGHSLFHSGEMGTSQADSCYAWTHRPTKIWIHSPKHAESKYVFAFAWIKVELCQPDGSFPLIPTSHTSSVEEISGVFLKSERATRRKLASFPSRRSHTATQGNLRT